MNTSKGKEETEKGKNGEKIRTRQELYTDDVM